MVLPYSLWLLCLLVVSPTPSYALRPRPSTLKRTNPTYVALNDTSLTALAQLTDLDDILDFRNPKSALSRILVPRAPGSKNLADAQALVVRHFQDLGWHVERDSFETTTPVGSRPFTNLVFTHDPDATRRLVLAAHLDSKYFPSHPLDDFVGATDSAAPCAMLLDLSKALTPWLDARRDRVVVQEGGEEGGSTQGETLQIIFFDGEEAFGDWTHEDSIYGAKHLAQKWKTPTVGPTPNRPIPATPLSRISHLVLLDLLGAPNPLIRSYHTSTGWFFDEFQHSELRLGQAGLLWPNIGSAAEYDDVKSKWGALEKSFFVSRDVGANFWAGTIEDDHLPFLANGVPIVHLIAFPFPRVWHTLKDDASALDLPTVKAWALILRLTVAEYLGLDPSIEVKAQEEPNEPNPDKRRRRRTKDDLIIAAF